MLLKNHYLYALIAFVSLLVLIIAFLHPNNKQSVEHVNTILFVIEGPDCYEPTRGKLVLSFVAKLKPCCSNNWNRQIILTDIEQSKLYQYLGKQISVSGVCNEIVLFGVSFKIINQTVIDN